MLGSRFWREISRAVSLVFSFLHNQEIVTKARMGGSFVYVIIRANPELKLTAMMSRNVYCYIDDVRIVVIVTNDCSCGVFPASLVVEGSTIRVTTDSAFPAIRFPLVLKINIIIIKL